MDEVNESLVLQWVPNQEDDLQKYEIYKSTTSGSGYAFIGAVDNTSTSFVDADVNRATRYYYVIVAVDHWENSSPYSNEASGTLPKESSPENWLFVLIMILLSLFSIIAVVVFLWKKRKQGVERDEPRNSEKT
ncbi:MAG: hypothetical protein ACE5KV_01620 [Thermoplasmata archaeon]